MEPLEARELREENIKLKRLVGDSSLDKVMLQDPLTAAAEPPAIIAPKLGAGNSGESQ
jgi:hypothetical protein